MAAVAPCNALQHKIAKLYNSAQEFTLRHLSLCHGGERVRSYFRFLAGWMAHFPGRMPEVPSIATVAGYAGFGAFCFLVSVLLLSVVAWRRKRA
jgi:hypothetical protein